MKHLTGNHLSPKSFQAKYFQSWSRGRQRWSYSWAEFCMGSFTSGKFCLPHSKRDYHISLQKFNLHSLLKHMALKAQQVLLVAEIRKKRDDNVSQYFPMSLMHRSFTHPECILVSSPASLIQIDFCSFFLVKGEKTQSQVPLLSFQNFRGLVKCLLFFIQNPKRKTLNKTVPTWTPFFKWFLEPEIPRRPLWAWSMWLPPWQPKPTGER